MINKPAIILFLTMFHLAAYAQQTYRLDAKKSKILWNTRNTLGGHNGYLLFNTGNLNYSAMGEPTDGSFSMDMNSIRSTDHAVAAENQKTDKELRKPGFFDIEKHPGAIMNVKQINATGKAGIYKVSGDLTIKGITNPIDFEAAIRKKGNTVIAKADLEIHRLKWNIDLQPEPKTWDFFSAVKDKMIADEIVISLNLVFNNSAGK
jgi:polyisoprenoid-binding protein YceI